MSVPGGDRVFRLTLVLLALFGGLVADAHAQVPPPAPWPGPAPRAGSWEAGGGVLFTGGFGLGSVPAELTPNLGTPPPFQLFATDSRLQAVTGVQGRLGRYLTRSLALEAGVSYARPVLRIGLSEDREGAPAITVEATLQQYVFDGSLVLHIPGAAFARGRAVPFLRGGAGHLRELSSGNELVETGMAYHAGGGIKLWFGDARRRFGIRGEAGLSIRDGGFDFRDGRRTVPVASTSLVYLF